jgi:hypothetical protein
MPSPARMPVSTEVTILLPSIAQIEEEFQVENASILWYLLSHTAPQRKTITAKYNPLSSLTSFQTKRNSTIAVPYERYL